MVHFLKRKSDGQAFTLPERGSVLSSNILEQDDSTPRTKKQHLRNIGSVLRHKTQKTIQFGVAKKQEYDKQKKENREALVDGIDDLINNDKISATRKFILLRDFAVDNKNKLSRADIAFINKNLQKIEAQALKQKKAHDKKDRENIAKDKASPMPVTFAQHADEEPLTQDEAGQINKAEARLEKESEKIEALDGEEPTTFADEPVREDAFEKLPDNLKFDVHMRRSKEE